MSNCDRPSILYFDNTIHDVIDEINTNISTATTEQIKQWVNKLNEVADYKVYTECQLDTRYNQLIKAAQLCLIDAIVSKDGKTCLIHAALVLNCIKHKHIPDPNQYYRNLINDGRI